MACRLGQRVTDRVRSELRCFCGELIPPGEEIPIGEDGFEEYLCPICYELDQPEIPEWLM